MTARAQGLPGPCSRNQLRGHLPVEAWGAWRAHATQPVAFQTRKHAQGGSCQGCRQELMSLPAWHLATCRCWCSSQLHPPPSGQPGPFLFRTTAPTPAAKSAPGTQSPSMLRTLALPCCLFPGLLCGAHAELGRGCGYSWQEGHRGSVPTPSLAQPPRCLPRGPKDTCPAPGSRWCLQRARGGWRVARSWLKSPEAAFASRVPVPAAAEASGSSGSKCSPPSVTAAPHPPLGNPGPGRCPVSVLRRGNGRSCLTRSRRPGSQQGPARECVRTVWGRRPAAPLQLRGQHTVACGSVAPPGAEWAPVLAAYSST